MRTFVNENSKTITKFVTNQIVMSLLGIMVGLAILSIEGGDGKGMSAIALIGGVFCVGFLCFLQYDNMFFAGEHEGIRARSENKKPDYAKGYIIALLSYSPTLIVGFVTMILSVAASDNATAVALFVYYAFQGSYISLYSLQGALGVFGYVAVTLLPVLIASGLGFIMGAKDLPIRKALGFNVKPPYEGQVEKRRDYRGPGGSDKE